MKRLLKKPPPKLRPLKRLLKKAPTPLLLAPKPLPLVPTLPLLAPKLLLRPTLLLPRPLTPPRLKLLRLLPRLKKRSKSQPFGAMTETKKSGLPSGRPLFFASAFWAPVP
ncbi:hypothetical protein [Sphingopyxis sp.]|uniref:hypothetical protein n=1 Tax=Sphingopyxis sp. TaxID=1908224 RepID=UPI002DF04A66|nr:hypothetical protein [Sphingopyxis sp.]